MAGVSALSRTSSLRAKTIIPLVVVGVIVGLAGAWFTRETFKRQMETHAHERRGEAIASALNTMIRTIDSTPGLAAHPDTLQNVVQEMGDLPDVTLIVVVSGEPPRVAACTREDWLNQRLTDLPYERVQEDLLDAIETRQLHRHYHKETLEYDISWPLALQTEHRPHGDYQDGAIMIHLDSHEVLRQLRIASSELIGALLVSVGVVTGLAYVLLSRFVLAPLVRINSAMRRRQSGDAAVFAPELGSDEIGAVAGTLNSMLIALDSAEQKLRSAHDNLEEQVKQRTSELEHSHESLRRADRLATIGTLAAGVAHDLNNLLLPMRGRIRALEASNLSSDAREHLKDLRQSALFLGQLAESLRMCALDPDHEADSTSVTNLAEWWDRTRGLLLRALRSRTNAGDATLTGSIPADIPPIAIPPHRLTQAVLNLVVNAGDASSGDAHVELRAEYDGATSDVLIFLTDNGIGMDDATIKRACDPFFTTKPRGASTGLGLALAQGVARTAGGSLLIKSTLGKGTTVIIRARAAQNNSNAETVSANAPLAAISVTDSRLAGYISSLLASFGFHVARTDIDDPGTGVLWITDAHDGAIEIAAGYLARESAHRVIVIGEMNGAWEGLDIVALGASFDADDLRSALMHAGLPNGEGVNGV